MTSEWMKTDFIFENRRAVLTLSPGAPGFEAFCELARKYKDDPDSIERAADGLVMAYRPALAGVMLVGIRFNMDLGRWEFYATHESFPKTPWGERPRQIPLADDLNKVHYRGKATMSEFSFVACLRDAERMRELAEELLGRGFNEGPADWRGASRIRPISHESKTVTPVLPDAAPACDCKRSFVWKADEFGDGVRRLMAMGRRAAEKVNAVYLDMVEGRKPGDTRGLEIAHSGDGEFQLRVERLLVDADNRAVLFNVYQDFGIAYCEPDDPEADPQPVIAEKHL
jgi:hypothetical protein